MIGWNRWIMCSSILFYFFLFSVFKSTGLLGCVDFLPKVNRQSELRLVAGLQQFMCQSVRVGGTAQLYPPIEGGERVSIISLIWSQLYPQTWIMLWLAKLLVRLYDPRVFIYTSFVNPRAMQGCPCL